MSEQANVKGTGFEIKSANVVNGELTNVVFQGNAVNMLAMAHSLVKSSLSSIKNVQRPLQRKFDSLIEKLNVLTQDVQAEIETRKEREHAKDQRDVEKMCELLAKAKKGF